MSEQQAMATILARIQRLIDRGEEILATDGWDGYDEYAVSTFDEGAFVGWRAQCMTFLDGFLSASYYVSHASLALAGDDGALSIRRTLGILKALREDVEAGYLTTLRELIHADMFGNFLEMAAYLLSDGYKDPAAVFIGGVLEEHLRQLCTKHRVPTEVDTGSGPRPKKAEAMNTDLAKQLIYSKLDQKQVTAWLDLRNKAAHGKYGEYSADQVSLMLQGVQSFLTRYPA